MKGKKWNNTNNGKLEKKLQAVAKRVERLCRKYKLSYAEVYFIQTESTATLNVRAKSLSDSVLCNAFAFIPEVTE